MVTFAESLSSTILAVLQQQHSVQDAGPNCWSIDHPDASISRLDVSLCKGWLIASAAVSGSPSVSPWGSLECNAALPPQVRRQVSVAAGWRLVVESRFDGEADPECLVVNSLQALRVAIGSEAPANPPTGVCDLAALCAEAGWAGTARSTGSVAVPVDDREGWQALIDQSAMGVRVRLSLLKAQGLTRASRDAIGLLMNDCARGVRLIRPVADTREERTELLWEVLMGPRPDSALLDAALSALQLGGRSCGREVRALADDVLANAYLQVRGWSPSQVNPV